MFVQKLVRCSVNFLFSLTSEFLSRGKERSILRTTLNLNDFIVFANKLQIYYTFLT